MASSIQTPLDVRPQPFNRVDVHDAPCVLLGGMVYPLVAVSELLDIVVASEFVRKDLRVQIGSDLIPEHRHKSPSLNVGDHLSNEISFTLNDTGNDCLILQASPWVVGLPAEVCLVHFHYAGHLGFMLVHDVPNLGEYAPRCLISDSEFPLELLGRDARPCSRHQEESVKPRPERRAGMIEDRIGRGAYLVVAELALINLAILDAVVFRYPLALGAEDAIRETEFLEKFETGIVVRELSVELLQGIFCGLYLSHFSYLARLSIAHKVPDVKGYSRKQIK